MKHRPGIRSVLAGGVVGVALLATLGESSPSDSGSGGTMAPAGATTTAGAASSQTNPIPVGTQTTVAKGWDVRVDSAVMDDSAAITARNQFAKPDPGKQFTTVNVSVMTVLVSPERPSRTSSFHCCRSPA
jgi:hypothetical protein